MQGLWSAQRKKINLNTFPSPAPSQSTASAPSTEEQTQLDQEATAPETSITARDERTAEVRPPASNGKRKIRSSRGDEDNKRTRLVGSVAKIYTPPSVRLSDLGGVDSCVEKMLELVAMPLSHPEIYLHTGVQPPRGVLLHGPPGCGKTLLANAIGGVCQAVRWFLETICIYICEQELGVPFISVSAPSIVSGMSGESEKTLRETFEEAKVCPCCIRCMLRV